MTNQRALEDIRAVLCGVSPFVVGVGVAGANGFTVLPAVPGVLLCLAGYRRAGLAVAVLLEAVVLWRHGLTGALFLAGLWLSWQDTLAAHVGAVIAFVGAAVIGTHVSMAWLVAGATALAVLLEIGQLVIRRSS